MQRDSGPGTEFGSGGTQNISRFVDAGVYLYHRGASNVATRPDKVKITSPTGDVAIVKVNDWLPLPGEDTTDPAFQKGFINSYLTPTELYDRIKALADEFPEISEIVELPHKTNGYRRNAQALLGTTAHRQHGSASTPGPGATRAATDIAVDPLNPGAREQPAVGGRDRAPRSP